MLLIKNSRVVDPKSGFDQVADVLVDGKKIIRIANSIEEASTEIIDATGLAVASGLVDIHVHFHELGRTHKEDIHTGAPAATADGFTFVVMVTNTNPMISDVKTLKEVLASAAKEDVYVYTNATITKNFDGQHLTDSKALLENGALSFSDDGISLQSTKVLKEALDLTKANNAFVAVHEEDPELNDTLGFDGHIARDKFHFCEATGVAEYNMIVRGVMIAYDRGAYLHTQHLSRTEFVKMVESAQQLGANVTAGAAPQHFSKTEDLPLIKGPAAKMNPPLRTEKDCLAVIEGLKSGVISVIATDHAPHHADEKNIDDITKAPSGMTELEISLLLGLTNLVATGDLILSELLAKMTTNPSPMYDFGAGYLAENGPADIVIFADKEEHIVSDHFASKTSNSPLIGEKLQGTAKYTIYDGKIVYRTS